MKKRHYEQLKEIFPEIPDGFGYDGTKAFYAFNKYICFLHLDGIYSLEHWGHEYDFAHSRSFKTFLEKIRALRNEWSRESYKKSLVANVIKASIEDAGYEVNIHEEDDSDFLVLNVVVPEDDFFDNGVVRAYVWNHHIDVYYELSRMYSAEGGPQFIAPEAIETMIKCINLARKRMLNRSKK